MVMMVEAVLEYYGLISDSCRRERETVCVSAEQGRAEGQIRSFIREHYPALPPYSLLLDGYVLPDSAVARLSNGSRIKVLPWTGGEQAV